MTPGKLIRNTLERERDAGVLSAKLAGASGRWAESGEIGKQ